MSAPGNVAAENTGNPSEVQITWDAVPNAAYYRIGWVAYFDVEPIITSGGDWLEHFAFIDIENRGQTEQTITRLTPGVQYAFIMASNDGRYGTPRWPSSAGWAYLTLNDELLRLGLLSLETYVESSLIKANVSGYGLEPGRITVADFTYGTTSTSTWRARRIVRDAPSRTPTCRQHINADASASRCITPST